MSAGKLERCLQFQRRLEVDDGAGNYVDAYALQFEIAANVRYLRGGETILASRLEQVSPLIVLVRSCADTRQITGDWRAVDARDGTVFQIKERPRHPVDKAGYEDRAWLEMLCQEGVAG